HGAGPHAPRRPSRGGARRDRVPPGAAAVHARGRRRQPGAGVAGAVGAAGGARAGAVPRRAPEQALEEVAEAAPGAAAGEHLFEVETARAGRGAAEAGRRHLVAGTVSARAQLVVGLAAARVAQRLVGFVDGLEALLRAGLLADVGVVLARQAPVGGLDLRVAGARFHAQHAVVI